MKFLLKNHAIRAHLNKMAPGIWYVDVKSPLGGEAVTRVSIDSLKIL